MTIMQLPGVACIVGSVGPEAIPYMELDAIRSVCESDRVVTRMDHLVEGMRVEVISGPLRGMQGQFIRQDGHHYIVVRMHLIQQAVAVHIHMDEVAPLAPPVLASSNGPRGRVSQT